MADLSTSICGMKLRSPLILASGITDTTGASLLRAIRNGAGAAIIKSVSVEPREGHKGHVVQEFDDLSMINAMGLPNQGIKHAIDELIEAQKRTDAPLIANIYAGTVEDFGLLAREISKAKPAMIEVNISCPNVHDEFGTPFSALPEAAAKVTKEVKKNTSIPISIKLSPNTIAISQVAKAVEKAGADCITCINTLAGMLIDIDTAVPILSNLSGGISGKALKPVAVKAVYDCHEVVKIPIIGTGGVLTGRDAIEHIMAGAGAVGGGTALFYRGQEAFSLINAEMKEEMKRLGYKSIKEMIGLAHH